MGLGAITDSLSAIAHHVLGEETVSMKELLAADFEGREPLRLRLRNKSPRYGNGDDRADPEAHRDLIVRVAGYSDYFCDLSKALQDEIIQRTELESL